jgi:hypothetical protein
MKAFLKDTFVGDHFSNSQFVVPSFRAPARRAKVQLSDARRLWNFQALGAIAIHFGGD